MQRTLQRKFNFTPEQHRLLEYLSNSQNINFKKRWSIGSVFINCVAWTISLFTLVGTGLWAFNVELPSQVNNLIVFSLVIMILLSCCTLFLGTLVVIIFYIGNKKDNHFAKYDVFNSEWDSDQKKSARNYYDMIKTQVPYINKKWVYGLVLNIVSIAIIWTTILFLVLGGYILTAVVFIILHVLVRVLMITRNRKVGEYFSNLTDEDLRWIWHFEQGGEITDSRLKVVNKASV